MGRLDRYPALTLMRADGTPLALVRLAATRRARLLGLAGMAGLEPGTGLLIPHCRSVHTVGMRFAIDVIFLEGSAAPIVSAVRPRLGPGRAVACARASATLELAGGAAELLGMAAGDRLRLPPAHARGGR